MERTAALGNTILSPVVELLQYSLSWDLLFIGVVTLVVVVVSYGSWRKKIEANLPPGPRNWPVIGALFAMEPQLQKTLDVFANKYGHIVLFRLGVQTLVAVSSAEVAEEVLKHKDAEFCNRACPMTRSAAKYCGFDSAIFVFANYDADLKLRRKISNTELLTTAKIKSYEKLRTEETAVMVENIFRAIQSSNHKEDDKNSSGSTAPMGIGSIVESVIQNIIFSLVIGKRFDSFPPEDELMEYPDLQKTEVELFMTFNLADIFPWLTWLDPQGLLKKMRKFDKRQRRFYEMIIERGRAARKQKRESGGMLESDIGVEGTSASNFVDVLLRAQEDGAKISDTGMMGTILPMLVGGIETTSSQIEWVLLELARHPKVMQRLQYEVDAVVGHQRPLQEADLTSMPFLNAVVLECLRLHPIAPYTMPHVNMAPSTLGGYNIPAKTGVIVNLCGIGRDPKTWKDPLQFNPDRFMEGGSSLKANGSSYQFLPFSSGRRMCPGYNLATLVASRLVGTLVHAFDWAPPPGCSPEDLSIEEVENFLMPPKHRPYLVPTPRLSAQVYKSNIVIT